MLQTQTIEPATLRLLRQLCSFEELENFALVGGTNLALHYGQRISVDLNFFSTVSFDPSSIVAFVQKNFRRFELVFQQNQRLIFDIDSTRVDFVLYPFPWMYPISQMDDIRLASVEDIIPMKLQGMQNRQSKKDFWDLACLLKHYSLSKMLEIMKNSFPL